MSWSAVRGHDRVVAELRESMALGRFPHAFFFAGPEGVGKHTFARTLAQALLCERNPETSLDPCGACPSCLQVMAGTHPDVLQVERPEDKHELNVKVIRDLCVDLGLKPMHGHRRVAIVNDADDLNDEAANAFLKTLEEPPPGSVLILIGTSTELQLDTVLSRCRVVRFDPLSQEDLAGVLLQQGLANDPTEAERLAASAEGSVNRAKGLADPDFGVFRREIIDTLSGPRGFDAVALQSRLGAFVKEAGKERMDQRGRARLLFVELSRFFRGLLWQTAGLEPPSPDPDDRRAILTLAERLEPEDVFVLADRCLAAEYQLRRQAYLPLVLDSLVHDLAAVINRA
ncbi:MAG: DNA polymerase III subunit delta' [Isosphaeraceae bacterium]